MPWLLALTDDAMNPEQLKTFERAKTKLGIEALAPSWLRVLANSPEFLRDVFMNLERAVFADAKLAAKAKLLIAAISASHGGHRDLALFFGERAVAAGFSWDQVHEGLAIAATSTSFNHYYKFRGLSGCDHFQGFNTGIRASLAMKSSLGKPLAELISLVTSSANGCASCVSSHIETAAHHDVAPDQIDEAIRTASIVQAICHFLASSER
ncbi:MAG: carboxymuconolactone decarboxylase family protein [Bradymonadaceae bacterium]|nr:carboxymuconolactone decarboxylase family protein [Lujinxingiaceae bacterium]